MAEKAVKTATLKFTEEVWREIQKLKKKEYYDRPYVDIYEDLMKLGLAAYNDGKRIVRKEG